MPQPPTLARLFVRAAPILVLTALAGGWRSQEALPLGIVADRSTPEGVLVARVERGSQAEAGGVRRGDRIVGLGAAYVGSAAAFRQAVRTHRGETFGLKVRRGPYVVEALVPRDPDDPRFRNVKAALRRCASFCLDHAPLRWRECGCVTSECKTCNGCRY